MVAWMAQQNKRYKIQGMKKYCLLSITLSVILIFFSQCTKRIYIPVENYTERTDTLYRNILRSDSIYIRDSVVIEHKNDTIRIERWRDRWSNNIRHSDSVRIVHDSVRIEQPYPVEIVKEVSKPLQKWQKILQLIGVFSCVLLIIYAYKNNNRQ